MNKFIEYNSPEKEIIKDLFNTIPYMDDWISNIIEGYIYQKVSKVDEEGCREEYVLRYDNKEGECKKWYSGAEGQIMEQYYYKNGKEEGEYKSWYSTGQLDAQCYYKEGKEEGEYIWWYENGKKYGIVLLVNI